MSDDPVSDIRQKDDRYPRSAYDLVREAMRHTLETLGERRHVTASELLEGLGVFARAQYGPLARTVLRSCGLNSTGNVGDVVFNLIEAEEFGRNEGDTREDFDDVYDFDTAFPGETGPVTVHDPRKDDDIWEE